MAEPAERAEPETLEPVQVTLDRATYDRARMLADRWGTSVELTLAQLVLEALARAGSTASSVADAFPEGLSTDGLDPDEDAYWRELRDLTRGKDGRAEAKPGSAPAR
jgi:hypothetical protein